MGDMGEMYRDWREHKAEKRANNRALGYEALRERGYQFKTCNGGAHLVVSASHGVVIDFWPGTGKWIARAEHGGRAMRGHGLGNLMRHFPPAEQP